MRFKETEIVNKLVEVTIKDELKCDKCGCLIFGECRYDKMVTVPDGYSHFDAFNFTFKVKTGYQYPECQGGEQHNLDLCEKCSDEAMELLLKNGFEIKTEDWD